MWEGEKGMNLRPPRENGGGGGGGRTERGSEIEEKREGRGVEN